MITIGIIVCDKDYKLCSNLLQQIKERVHVPYEVVIVDNREKEKDVKVDYKIDFSFGHNVYQFEARRKIISLAKGDYIWFVDADDEVLGLEHFEYDDDMIIYNYLMDGSYSLLDKSLDKSDLMNSNSGLWNKIIKTKLFDKFNVVFNKPNTEMVATEDLMILTYLLTRLKTYRFCDDAIYKYNESYGSPNEFNLKRLEHLANGLPNCINFIKELSPDKKTFNNHIAITFGFLFQGISRMYDIDDEKFVQVADVVINKVLDAVGDDYVENIRNSLSSELCEHQMYLIYTVCPRLIPSAAYVSYDYSVNDFVKTHKQIELVKPKSNPFKISIITLFDDNSTNLDAFIKNVENKVRPDYELIIVDIRKNQANGLKISSRHKYIKASFDVGRLEGYRLGFEKSTGDYVWFVDVNDQICYVSKFVYDSNDIIQFKTINQDSGSIVPELFENNNFIWDKWIKRNILIDVFDNIPTMYHINTFEDVLICRLAMLFCRNPGKQYYVIYKRSIQKSFELFDNANHVLLLLSQNEDDKDFYKVLKTEATIYLRQLSRLNDTDYLIGFQKLISVFGESILKETINGSDEPAIRNQYVNLLGNSINNCAYSSSVFAYVNGDEVIFKKCFYTNEELGSLSLKGFEKVQEKSKFLSSITKNESLRHRIFITPDNFGCKESACLHKLPNIDSVEVLVGSGDYEALIKSFSRINLKLSIRLDYNVVINKKILIEFLKTLSFKDFCTLKIKNGNIILTDSEKKEIMSNKNIKIEIY